MKTFLTTNSTMVTECPLAFLLGDIDQYNGTTGLWLLKVSTNYVEGNETATWISDDSFAEEIKKVRTTAAQAGNYVVGFAPVSVVEQEFEDYQFYSEDNTPLVGSVAYRGRLKVSQTSVYTPAFLASPNVQFAL